MAKIDVRDIERIVFAPRIPTAENVYSDMKGGKKDKSMSEYVEEESYVNPPQVESQSEDEEGSLTYIGKDYRR
jgi:hypothetical protein